MQRFIYILAYPILYFISKLPFRLLYVFSDCVYFLVYRIIGYRKKTVRENLAMTLPHLSEKERKEVEIKFYKHMCDMFLEMIKTMSISEEEIEKRFVFKNIETYLELEKTGKSVALMCSHYASYEWVISMNRHSDYQGFAIYKKVNNVHFDNLAKRIRSRFKASLINSYLATGIIEENERNGIKGLYGFAADQSPRNRPKYYRTQFMGIEVPVFTGAETLSKRFDMNIVYLKVSKVKRGYYQAELELLTDNPKSIPNYQITETFFRKVEQQILEQPEYYLWTHRRWKHRTQNE